VIEGENETQQVRCSFLGSISGWYKYTKSQESQKERIKLAETFIDMLLTYTTGDGIACVLNLSERDEGKAK
jgi:hypothetical protein